MATFANWLSGLLNDGHVELDGPISRSAHADAESERVLAAAFQLVAADVAGPNTSFDPNTATAAAHYVADACWCLLDPLKSQALQPIAAEPKTAAAHLSADMTLRYLPNVYQRARLRRQDDPLAVALANELRRWPLSGVLADITDRPVTPLHFCGHRGLQMLYAERLVERPRWHWLPDGSTERQWTEYIFHERGRVLPPAPAEGDGHE